MLEIIAGLCVLASIFILLTLSKIDLREGILPNGLVLTFLCLGLAFHFSTSFVLLSVKEMLTGALMGAGILYMIRLVANWYYKDDTLGLGDVKLMGAAGLWLGPHYILIALITGAVSGALHGIGLGILAFKNTKSWPDFTKLSLPAGPGFAVGIVIAGTFLLKPFFIGLLP